ncbi:MAG TPA: nuclear transport factor 2 family protein [Xanthobacteraceae bacterium]|nr:nuclear transport factor 2 family protein [Xanthobacteraceae bacterium]
MDTTLRASEEEAVCKVRRVWAFSRDRGDWDTLRTCFHPDATITVAWYSGPASGFVERSIAMADARRPEEHHKHWLGNMQAEVNGARAVLESDAMVLIREYIDAYLFDYCSSLRFYDLVEKRDGVWRLLKASCIYEKDRLDPVVPGAVPASLYSDVSLTGHGAGFAFMRFRQMKKGRPVPPAIVVAGTPAEDALRHEARTWLSGA